MGKKQIQNLMQLITGEMSADPTFGMDPLLRQKYQMTSLIQNIIYFFNQTKIRDAIINHFIHLHSLPDKIVWDGTYYFNESGMMDPYFHKDLVGKQTTLEQFLVSRKNYRKNIQFIFFTACILYEENKVHYLAFVYDAPKERLVCFDPGIRLYHKGQDVLVPILTEAFLNRGLIPNVNNLERIGLCNKKFYGKQWGIQYEGSDPKKTNLPADSFCQLWTICFLVEFMKNRCSDQFLSHWCKIPPTFRESFALTYANQFFSLPFIYKEFKIFYPQGDLTKIMPFIIQNIP